MKPSVDRPSGESPLKSFRGVLQGYNMVEVTPEDGKGKPYATVTFDFVDVEVLEATEPYPFPTAKITIRYANPQVSRGGTKWAAFSGTVRKLADGDLDNLVGKQQVWSQLPGTVRSRDEATGEWSNVQMDCWQVASVEGGSTMEDDGHSILEYVATLLDGKTEAEFYQVFFTDQKVKSHPDVIEQATMRTLLPTMETLGLATRDTEGAWHSKVPV